MSLRSRRIRSTGIALFAPQYTSRIVICTTHTAPKLTLQKRHYIAMRDSEEFQRYTRARFVRDENQNMSSRYVAFSINKLTEAAARATGSASCAAFEKLSEGLNSKTFLLTMDDGAQAVAKLPNPCGGRPHFTTASEVATMDFARNELKIPVPKVLAWCSRADDTPVKAEYIIMEKARGVPLSSVYEQMNLKQRWTLVQSLAGYQLAFTAASFPGHGSLYYKDDLDMNSGGMLEYHPSGGVSDTNSTRFAIGPTTGWEWGTFDKLPVNFSRGPWTNAIEYFKAVGERERLCIEQTKQLPHPDLTLCGPGLFQPSRSRKTQAVACYQDLLSYLLPQDKELLTPSLAHHDLHAENIFVNPESPSEVTAVLDWTSTEIVPLLVQAQQPPIIDYEGPELEGLERPTKPANFAELSEDGKREATILQLQQTLVALYRILISKRHPAFWKCIEFEETMESSLLIVARCLLKDGEAQYLVLVAHFIDTYPNILDEVGRKDTLARDRLSALLLERESLEKEAEAAQAGMEVMKDIKEAMGDLFPEKEVVRHDQYDEAKRVMRQAKEQIIDQFARTEEDRIAWEKSWPFDD